MTPGTLSRPWAAADSSEGRGTEPEVQPSELGVAKAARLRAGTPRRLDWCPPGLAASTPGGATGSTWHVAHQGQPHWRGSAGLGMSPVTGAADEDKTTWSLRIHTLGPSEGPRADTGGPEAPACPWELVLLPWQDHTQRDHVRECASLASHHVSPRHGLRPTGGMPEGLMSLNATRLLRPHLPRLPVPTLGSSLSCCQGAGSRGSVPGPQRSCCGAVPTRLHVAWVVPDLTSVLRAVERGHAPLTTSEVSWDRSREAALSLQRARPRGPAPGWCPNCHAGPRRPGTMLTGPARPGPLSEWTRAGREGSCTRSPLRLRPWTWDNSL